MAENTSAGGYLCEIDGSSLQTIQINTDLTSVFCVC